MRDVMMYHGALPGFIGGKRRVSLVVRHQAVVLSLWYRQFVFSWVSHSWFDEAES